MKTLKKLLLMSIALILVTSCSKEDAVEREAEIPEGKIPVKTEVIVDGVLQTNTRASTEAGFTTGDGLYDEGDPVTVTAVANDGYELVKFYDKSGDEKYQDQSSYTFPAKIPQTFKAEFARKYTITVSASPTAGGTVSGGGKFRSGKTCTLTAAANAGYSFDGWYEGSTKLSSSASYSFTVSSNRTIMGKFAAAGFIIVGDNGYVITPLKTQQVDNEYWSSITYGNGKYVMVGFNYGYISSSNDGINWTTPKRISQVSWYAIAYGNGKFVIVGSEGYISTSTDGVNWTAPKSVATENWVDIAYGNGKFIAVRAAAYGGAGYISTSTDGINWTTPKSVGTAEWNGIAYGNGNFIIVGSNGSIARSSDGITWYKSTPSSGAVGSITYGNGKFVAIGYGGKVISSTSGTSWTTTSVSGSATWNKIRSNTGSFISVGSSGYISKSSNGTSWTSPEQIKDDLGEVLNINLNDACAIQ